MIRRTTVLAVALAFLLVGSGLLWWRSQPPAAAYDVLETLVMRPDVGAAIANASPEAPAVLAAKDKQWRLEAANKGGPLINAVMATPLSRQLTTDRLASAGHIEQIMVMDARGALIAADAPTHDYDQSDEPKWQRTIGARTHDAIFEGTDTEHRGKVDQLSKVVVNTNGQIVGAVTLRWCRTKDGCI